MAITKVWIIEGCISCGVCENTCPEVFEIQDTAVVKTGIKYSGYEEKIEDAAAACPVEVIKFE